MNEKELKLYIRDFKKYSKYILSSKKRSQKFLINAGIHTKTGKLTKRYK